MTRLENPRLPSSNLMSKLDHKTTLNNRLVILITLHLGWVGGWNVFQQHDDKLVFMIIYIILV